LWSSPSGEKFKVCCDLTSNCYGYEADDQDTWWKTYDIYDCDGNDEVDFATTKIEPGSYPRDCLYVVWHRLIALEEKMFGSNKRVPDTELLSIKDHAIYIWGRSGFAGIDLPTSYIIINLEYGCDLIVSLIDELMSIDYTFSIDRDVSLEEQLNKIWTIYPDTAMDWDNSSIEEKYYWVDTWVREQVEYIAAVHAAPDETGTDWTEAGVDAKNEGFKSNNKLRNKILKNKNLDSKFIKKKGNQLTRSVLFGWNAFKKEIIK
jgi:hypothetical protein